jgi:hypothetical protein
MLLKVGGNKWSIIFSVQDSLRMSGSGSGEKQLQEMVAQNLLHCVRFEVLTVVQLCGRLKPCKLVSSCCCVEVHWVFICWVKW